MAALQTQQEVEVLDPPPLGSYGATGEDEDEDEDEDEGEDDDEDD